MGWELWQQSEGKDGLKGARFSCSEYMERWPSG